MRRPWPALGRSDTAKKKFNGCAAVGLEPLLAYHYIWSEWILSNYTIDFIGCLWLQKYVHKVSELCLFFSLFSAGFSTFNDMTYPLVTQTVITNGKLWSFYVYQLNTSLLHAEHTSNNPRHNLCWGTPELKLFEAIEDGKVIGKQLKLNSIILCVYVYAHLCSWLFSIFFFFTFCRWCYN